MFNKFGRVCGPGAAPKIRLAGGAVLLLLSTAAATMAQAASVNHTDAVFASMQSALTSMQSTTPVTPAPAAAPATPALMPSDPRYLPAEPPTIPAPPIAQPLTTPVPAPAIQPAPPPRSVQAPPARQYGRDAPRRSYDTVQGPRRQSPAPATGRGPDAYKDGWYAINTDYWLNYPLTVWRMATAPTRFDTTDWLVAAGVIGVTGFFLTLDEEIQSFWQDTITGSTSDSVFDVFNVFGDTKYVVGGSIGLYAVAEALDQTGVVNARRAKATGLLTAQSVLIAQGITGSIKWLGGRDRPNESDSRFDFRGPGNGDNKAFPSGHATVAFALATTVSEIYGPEYRWVPWIAYPTAIGTALSRIDRNKHWASDVFLGGVIGYAVAKTVTHYSPFLEKQSISFRQLESVDGPGLLAVRKF